MQMPTISTGIRLSFPPLYRWHKSLRRAIWVGAVVTVACIYLLMTVGLVSGLAVVFGLLS